MEKSRNAFGNLAGGEIGDALTLDEFRSVYRSGGFRAVGLMGSDSGFAIWGRTANNTRVMLVATRSRTRRYFGSPVMAFKLLQDMGVLEFQVELKDWYPRVEQTNHSRADVSSRMRRLHRVGKKQMEEERANAVMINPAEMYEAAARKISVPRVSEASGPEVFWDSEGRMDVRRTNAWLQAEREARERTEGGRNS